MGKFGRGEHGPAEEGDTLLLKGWSPIIILSPSSYENRRCVKIKRSKNIFIYHDPPQFCSPLRSSFSPQDSRCLTTGATVSSNISLNKRRRVIEIIPIGGVLIVGVVNSALVIDVIASRGFWAVWRG